jgi:hypothetical protein
MKYFVYLSVLALIFALPGKMRAQKNYHISKGRVISVGEADNEAPEEQDVVGWGADPDVQSIWKQILQTAETNDNASLLNSLVIVQSPIYNIYSQVDAKNGEKDIFYDREFFNQFNGVPEIDVAYLKLFSFLHELGHYINGDAQNIIHTKEAEEKADFYACSILCKMGIANQYKIRQVLLTLDGSFKHKAYFSKGQRLLKIGDYFTQNPCPYNKGSVLETFSSSNNLYGFWVGKTAEYVNDIDTASQSYVMTLYKSANWNWTWVPFPKDYVEIFSKNDKVELSFDFLSNKAQQQDLIGFLTEPQCVSNSCLGGSHYDLWFRKSNYSANSAAIECTFSYNDNCGCKPNMNIKSIVKNTNTGDVTHIKLVKAFKIFTVYVDNQPMYNFELDDVIITKLAYGIGEHYLKNFKISIL